MNAYQREQQLALIQAINYLECLTSEDRRALKAKMTPYTVFREQVDQFLSEHCGEFCTRSCYTSKTSACCSKDGIITFWADVLINACYSSKVQLSSLMESIQKPEYDHKCIYLGANGCLWQVRPLVCTMFLCDQVQQALIEKDKKVYGQWKALNSQAKSYRWPDRPVLFDHLEQSCIDAGIQSSLMYLNNSPGLLRVKQKAGL